MNLLTLLHFPQLKSWVKLVPLSPWAPEAHPGNTHKRPARPTEPTAPCSPGAWIQASQGAVTTAPSPLVTLTVRHHRSHSGKLTFTL